MESDSLLLILLRHRVGRAIAASRFVANLSPVSVPLQPRFPAGLASRACHHPCHVLLRSGHGGCNRNMQAQASNTTGVRRKSSSKDYSCGGCAVKEASRSTRSRRRLIQKVFREAQTVWQRTKICTVALYDTLVNICIFISRPNKWVQTTRIKIMYDMEKKLSLQAVDFLETSANIILSVFAIYSKY